MSTATDMLANYIAAETAILKGKEYMMNGRRLSYENLAEIRKGRQEWQQKVDAESAASGGGSSNYSVADFT